jgi:hypothetical protein
MNQWNNPTARLTRNGVEVTVTLPVRGDVGFAVDLYEALSAEPQECDIIEGWIGHDGEWELSASVARDMASAFELTMNVAGHAVKQAVPEANTEWWWDPGDANTMDDVVKHYMGLEWLDCREEWAAHLMRIAHAVEAKSIPDALAAHAAMVLLVRSENAKDPEMFYYRKEAPQVSCT